jgi:polar amino acid transport system substrate-binding protein
MIYENWLSPLRIISILALWLWAYNTCAAQSPQTIVFNVTPKGFPPFMIKTPDGQYKGIMFDVTRIIAQKHGYSITTVGLPKKRELRQLDSGDLDATPMAKEWVKFPENYLFSDSVIKVRDVLFSLTDNPIEADDLDALSGKVIGAHLGYSYPKLNAYFESNKIIRSDASTETEMLGKLLFERTDAAVLNEMVGRWIVKSKSEWKGAFFISKHALNEVPFRVIFNKNWHQFLPVFNNELQTMKKSGELKAIILKYQ